MASPSPEPSATITSGEALERVLKERGREAWAFVDDVECNPAGRTREGEADVTASVAQGVVDHVRERLLESEAVATKLRPWFDLREE